MERRRGRIYLPEDLDEDEIAMEGCMSLNNCTSELRLHDNTDFDYGRYEYYNYLKLLDLHVRRFDEERASEEETQPVTIPHSEEALKELFIKRYGLVDFKNPLMTKRLDVMRNSLLESSTQSLNEEEMVIRLLNEGFLWTDVALWIQGEGRDMKSYYGIKDKLVRKLTVPEMKTFQSVKPADAVGDLFHLPRCGLVKIRREQVADYLTSEKSNTAANLQQIHVQKKNGEICKGVLKHLHVYDPKFEYCFTQPYRILDIICDQSYIEGLNIPRMAAFRILEHLNKFPNGVTREIFWETFYKQHGGFLKLVGLPIHKVFDFLPGEVMIVPENGSYPELVFPGFLEGMVNPQLILKRLWHSITCVLSRHLYVLDSDLMQHVENDFGFKFDPLHWEFRTVIAFMKWCLDLFSLENVITIHRVRFLKDRRTSISIKNYICLNVPSLLKKMECLAEATKVECKKILRIPKDCVGQDYKVAHLSDFISEGEHHVMELIGLYGPRRLVFRQRRYRKEALTFQEDLQIFPFKENIERTTAPRDSQLTSGMYVMARVDWDGVQWYRGRIIWQNPKTAKYYVYGIDAGFLRQVELNNIRFMPLSIAQKVAFAVPIRLDTPRWTRKRKYTFVAKQIIEEVVMPTNLVEMEFQKSKPGDAMGCQKWSVACSVLCRNGQERIHLSLASTFCYKLEEAVTNAIKKENAEKAAK